MGSDMTLGEPEGYGTLKCKIIGIDKSCARADRITRTKITAFSRDGGREDKFVTLTGPGLAKVDFRKLDGRRLDRELVVRWRLLGAAAARREYAH